MPRKIAEEAEEYVIHHSEKHLDPNCKCDFVEEIEGAFHCPCCGAWEYRVR